jgi:hypothetical protein
MKNVVVLSLFLTLSQVASAQEKPDLPAGSGRGRAAIEGLLQATGLGVSAGGSPEAAAAVVPQSFLVQWDSGQDKAEESIAVPAGSPIPGRFTLAEQRPGAGSLPRQRFPELSPERLVVAAVDRSQQLLAWVVIPDPRLLRSELPDARGEMRHQSFYRSTVQFWAHLSAAAEASELHIYQPVWQGEEFTLKQLATIALAGGNR